MTKNGANLYKATMKALNTAQNYVEWAEEAKCENEIEIMQFFGKRALDEIDKDMTETLSHLKKELEKDDSKELRCEIINAQMEIMERWADKIKKSIKEL